MSTLQRVPAHAHPSSPLIPKMLLYNPPVPSPNNGAEWSAFTQAHPNCHLLQTAQWGELKSSFGWYTRHVIEADRGAQILFRTLPFGFKLAYIPHGPVGAWLPELLPALDQACRREGVFMLKIEPDQLSDDQFEGRLQAAGLVQSAQTIQPPRTIHISLIEDEETILARMKQKTRYNIRLAARKGVKIRPWDDITSFAAMTEETAERDAFGAHNHAYFQKAYDLFHARSQCELLVAEVERDPVAALMVYSQGQRAWYLYGASRAVHREKMPAYLLQWEAIRWAKSRGCVLYDLWGIPDYDEDALETQFSRRSDGLWGVYRFKRGFGGQVTRSSGAWDRVYNPVLYHLYSALSRLRE